MIYTIEEVEYETKLDAINSELQVYYKGQLIAYMHREDYGFYIMLDYFDWNYPLEVRTFDEALRDLQSKIKQELDTMKNNYTSTMKLFDWYE